MRRAVVGLAAVLLAAGSAVLWTRSCAAQARRDQARWEQACIQAFLRRGDPEDARRANPRLPFAVHRFGDGSWIAVCAHTIHDEAPPLNEWDRAMLYDSRGTVHRTTHHFCGQEGLEGELRAFHAASLDGFYREAPDHFPLQPEAPRR